MSTPPNAGATTYASATPNASTPPNAGATRSTSVSTPTSTSAIANSTSKTPTSKTNVASNPIINILLVDDSAVARGMLTRVIEADPELRVVAAASDGEMAIALLKRNKVDVIILDLEMPKMDGMTALPHLLAIQPTVSIIISSNITRENAEIAFRAMRSGAKDYLSKPSTTSEMNSVMAYRRELISKIKAISSAAKAGLVKPNETHWASPAPEVEVKKRTVADILASTRQPLKPVVLRPMPSRHDLPLVIAIGSSTGGPQALFTLLHELSDEINQPIFITQHMPATFTTILAEHIARISHRTCVEASEGMVVKNGQIYVAPGDFHMLIEQRSNGEKYIRIVKDEPENFCRPSVDPMLRSLSKVYGAKILTIILTGMGRDGQAGSRVVVENGGLVVAQDEASSVVWGMPGAVATAGLCSSLFPIQEMSKFLKQYATRVTM